MRRFHSYGPVNSKYHFCVERDSLIEQCMDYLIGEIDDAGHYFTIWSPRQTGKTWLMRQVKKKIETAYEDNFIVGAMSFQGVILKDDASDEDFLSEIPRLFMHTFGVKVDVPVKWAELGDIFSKVEGAFDKPVILFIDEFDSLPPAIIDSLVTLFRDMHLNKDTYLLHGLALIGVRAVLGVDSLRGSPFNIQRSLHIENFSEQEVQELFRQFKDESGQDVKNEVVEILYEKTRGQPGLIGWFGELLTEKYNPGQDKIIDLDTWEEVFMRACHVEWNNTVLNIIKKARTAYLRYVLELFSRSDIPFTLKSDWCSFLYMNGIIDSVPSIDKKGTKIMVCRFSNPFIQISLYDALTLNILNDRLPILALEPLDELIDVFENKKNPEIIDLPALLERYKKYLERLKAAGLNPWKDQPRRADLNITEAVGHFHLYHWLQNAVGIQCVISPEFPTGNGKVDLNLYCDNKQGIIEVKSFKSMAHLKEGKKQAADYAEKIGISAVTLALFAPLDDEKILTQLSSQEIIDDIEVTVVAIGMVER